MNSLTGIAASFLDWSNLSSLIESTVERKQQRRCTSKTETIVEPTSPFDPPKLASGCLAATSGTHTLWRWTKSRIGILSKSIKAVSTRLRAKEKLFGKKEMPMRPQRHATLLSQEKTCEDIRCSICGHSHFAIVKIEVCWMVKRLCRKSEEKMMLLSNYI